MKHRHKTPSQFTVPRQFIQSSSSGFTLVELIVSLVISGILLSLVLSILVANRKLFAEDIARNEVAQNLRAAIDIIGTDVKQAGERITEPNFPVIEIKNGNLLTVRLNSELPVLRNCQAIAQGTSTAPAISTNCGNTNLDLQEWQNYRCSLDGVAGCQGNANEKARAFIHDGSGNITAFDYSSEDLTNLSINRLNQGDAWEKDYPVNSTIYLLRENQYRLVNNNLEMIVDGKTNKPLKIVNGIASFGAEASLKDSLGTTGNFGFNGSGFTWWQLESININLQAIDPSPQKTDAYSGVAAEKLNVTAQFFPRNSLSR